MKGLPVRLDTAYWDLLNVWAVDYKSDGCTMVPDLFCIEACREHDYHYRYAMTMFGDAITFEESNTRIRQVIQMWSPLPRGLKWMSPTSWTFWYGVREGGKGIWKAHRERNLQPPKL